jgi:hypothetical protein
LSDIDWIRCKPCPVGQYSDIRGASECKYCQYPFGTVGEGSDSCPTVQIDMSPKNQMIFFCVLSFAFFICLLQADEEFIPAFLRMASPTFDVFSDVAYLLTNNYYSTAIFISGMVFFFISNMVFIYFLWDNSHRPRFPWEYFGYHSIMNTQSSTSNDIEKGNNAFSNASANEADKGTSTIETYSASATTTTLKSRFISRFICIGTTTYGFPTIAGTPLIQDHQADSMTRCEHLGYTVSLWLLALCIQIIFSLYVIACCLLNPGFILVWFIVGCMLFQTKLFSIDAINSFWIQCWTGKPKPVENEKIEGGRKPKEQIEEEERAADEKRKRELYVFSLALFGEFLLETIPQTVIQAMSNTFWKRWTMLSYVSMGFSGIIVIDGLWFFVYHRLRSNETFAEIAARRDTFGKDKTISGGKDFQTIGELNYQIDPVHLTVSRNDLQTDEVILNSDQLHAARELWFVLTSSFLSVDMCVAFQDNDVECSVHLLTCTAKQLNQVIRRALELARYDGGKLDGNDYEDFKKICTMCDKHHQRRHGHLTFIASLFVSPIRFTEVGLKGKKFYAKVLNQINALLQHYRENLKEKAQVEGGALLSYYKSLLEILEQDRQYFVHFHPNIKRSDFHDLLNASLKRVLNVRFTLQNEDWGTCV